MPKTRTHPQPQVRRWSLAGTRRDLVLAGALFLASRLVCFAALGLAAASDPRTLGEVLTVFDGGHYASIVANGYPAEVPVGPEGVQRSTLAFFPLFPLLTAGPVALGVPFPLAAVAVGLAAGTAAALALHLVVSTCAGARAGLGAVALWSTQPVSFVLSLAYSEALYCALAFAALALCQRRWWLTGGAVAALASATRPSGVVLSLCLAVVALLALRAGAPDRGRTVVAALLAPLGAVAYQGWLWQRTGRADVWFATQREGWGVATDGGADVARRLVEHLGSPTSRPAGTAVSLMVLVALALLATAVHDAVRTRAAAAVLPLLFATGSIALALTTRNAFSSTPRFVLPAVGILVVPLVVRLQGRTSSSTAEEGAGGPGAAVLVLAGLSSLAMAAAGAYLTVASVYPP